MLRHIRVVPLAAESLGVRSMCTSVETYDVRILLDAGVSLCPDRFGLPPHPLEYKAIIECRQRIAEVAERAHVVTLSHYHFDHHTPSFEDWVSHWTEPDETARQVYEGKTVLVKSINEKINYSQRRRGWMFQKTGGAHARKIESADGKTFTFGNTTVQFSDPVFHGPEDSFLGWVLMTTIKCEAETFMFAPDVQGPISTRTLDKIIEEKPDLLTVGGPPSYLSSFRVDERQIQAGLESLKKIVRHVPITILEHHFLRDEKWNEKSADIFYSAYSCDHVVLTAAEFLGKKNSLLEASRKKLYAENPPSKEYGRWMRIGSEARRLAQPPL